MAVPSSSNRIRLDDPLEDGRQSAQALAIQRGTMRHLRRLGLAVVPELTLASGRRADLVGLTPQGEIWIVEIKSSLADFRSDMKWPDYRSFCDRLFFASSSNVPMDIFPEDAGFVLADDYGAEIIRDAPIEKMAAARRKAVTIRFAQAAAHRLHKILDPDCDPTF